MIRKLAFIPPFIRRLLYLIGIVSFLLWGVFFSPNILLQTPTYSLTIQRETTFPQLVQQLRTAGLKIPQTFQWTAEVLRYHHIRPGVYTLNNYSSNWRMIRQLRAGLQTPVRITLSTANTPAEVVQQLTAGTGVNPQAFAQLLTNASFLRPYGFTPDNVLAMFLPNTYEVYWTISPKALFQRMHKVYQDFWTPERIQQAAQYNLSPIEVAILASIVQAETNLSSEAALIAGVYCNRLRKNMPLQADPTLKWALQDPTRKRLLHADLLLDSPYNTYRYRGLPPGPIGLPSITSIEAVLQAENHNYLYFAAHHDLSGRHCFSSTFAEHCRHARRYQKNLDKSRVYR